MPSLHRILPPGLLALVLGMLVSAPGLARDAQLWHFNYFAGDPPTWKDQPGSFKVKAECEIARAEKTAAGYPVGECYALPRGSSPQTVKTPVSVTPQKVQSSDEIETQRKHKLAEGCRVACNATLRTCTSSIPAQRTCIQAENATCIERCTHVEQLPHHQCINEVCLPNEVNMATWQGLCESREELAHKTCQTTHVDCERSCNP